MCNPELFPILYNRKLRGGLGGFLPESNDLTIGLIPLRKNRWSEMRVRLPNPSTTGGRMKTDNFLDKNPMLALRPIESIQGYRENREDLKSYLNSVFTISYHKMLWCNGLWMKKSFQIVKKVLDFAPIVPYISSRDWE